MTIIDKLERAIEYHKHNWLEEAERQYRIILAENSNHEDANYNLGTLAMQVNKPNLAIPFFKKALSINPEKNLYKEALLNAEKKLEISFSPDENIEKNIFELIGNDFIFERKIKSLETKLSLLNGKLNNMHEALNYLDIFKMKEFNDSSSKMLPIEIVNKGSSKTLITFGGMASGISMPPKEFFNSLVEKNINIIFVKDFKQCWYQEGFLGKTTDITSSINYLENIIPKESRELITLGASAGGYAAIRFGIELNACRIMAFSPQTLIDKETASVFSKDCLNTLNFDSDDLDLRKILSRKKEKSNIEVYYGQLNNRDRINAEYIKEYIIEFSYDTDEHLLASYLKKKGILEKILETV